MSPRNSEKFSSNEVAESKTVSQQTDANSSEKDTINFKINKKTAKVGALALAGVVGVSSLFAGLSACRDKSKVKAFESTTAPTEITEIIESSQAKETTIAAIANSSEIIDTSDASGLNWYKIDWTKQDEEIQRLNNLSVEDFRKEPIDKQLQYCCAVYDIYYDNYCYGQYGINSNILFAPDEYASLDDSLEEIVNQEKTKFMMINTATDANGNFNSVTARKLLSFTVDNIDDYIAEDSKTTTMEDLDNGFKNTASGQKFSRVLGPNNFTYTGANRSEIKYSADGTPYVEITKKCADGSIGDAVKYSYIELSNGKATWVQG